MAPTRRDVTILIAEDDPDDYLLTREALEEHRLAGDLRFVRDGEELMDYLHRRGEYTDPTLSPRPGLVLLDLNMPRKDGREALMEMKADPGLRRIPVVILTTSRAHDDVLDSYNSGANSYITKPSTFSELLEATRALGDYWFNTVELPNGHTRH